MTLGISFLIILFLVALLYSIIGHGGASGYIALMVMFSVPFVSNKLPTPQADGVLIVPFLYAKQGFVASDGEFTQKRLNQRH